MDRVGPENLDIFEPGPKKSQFQTPTPSNEPQHGFVHINTPAAAKLMYIK
jgi:hypothetical protein